MKIAATAAWYGNTGTPPPLEVELDVVVALVVLVVTTLLVALVVEVVVEVAAVELVVLLDAAPLTAPYPRTLP